MRFFLLIFCIISIKTTLFSQELKFRHLNVDDGLSQTSVVSIIQDKKGFLWFGTRSGLNRYDSKTIKIYKGTEDTTTLSSSYVSHLLMDNQGTLWIGTTNGLNVYREKTDDFKRLLYQKSNRYSISNNTINDIYQDRSNRIWVCTKAGLSLLSDRKLLKFTHITFEDKSITECYTIFQDRQGLLWLSTNKGLALIEMHENRFRLDLASCHSYNAKINAVPDNYITSIIQDKQQTIWIGTKQTGLNTLNKVSTNGKKYEIADFEIGGLISNNIRKIILNSDGKLWMGTVQGIRIVDPISRQVTALEHDPADPESLSQNSVYSVFQDKQGIVWVGTYYGGASYVLPNLTPFKKYPVLKSGNALNNNVISAMLEDRQRNLWICTEGGGLNYFSRNENRFTHYKHDKKNNNTISSNILKAIIQDDHNIWIGTYLGKLDVYNRLKNEFDHYQATPGDSTGLISAEVNCLFKDKKGRIWIGTDKGIHEFSKNLHNIVRYSHNGPKESIFFIFEDKKSNLWVSSANALYVLYNNSTTFKRVDFKIAGKLIYLGRVNYINEDKKDNLWLSLDEGIIVFNQKTNKIKRFDKKNGLVSDNIRSILNDDDGNVWLGSDKGLIKYSLAKENFVNYDTRDGLPGNEFNYRSALKTEDGELFFGGLNGLTSFYPDKIKTNHAVPNIILTDLKLFNNVVRIDENNGILKSNLSITKSITLKSSDNVFSIDFAVLNFIKADKNKYAYKLQGFEENWNYVSSPTASYTNLSPGSYTLLVKGSNNDAIWTAPLTLQIEILPPFYRTWWAYLFYLSVLTGMLFILIRYLLIRVILKKEKEINKHKLDFFTNISHEIRTPLTLIIGPLEKLISKIQNEQELSRDLQVIKNGADRLMKLVTELLDFRKAESGKMALHITSGNFVKFCKEIFLAFQNMAINKNINYNFHSQAEQIELYFDSVQLEKVLFNLLSNAFKFTQPGGTINIDIEETDQNVLVKISDNGKGIPLAEQTDLFSNFYQASTENNIGSGLGLAISKSIIELHHGNISVSSTPQTEFKSGNTCFTFVLKKEKLHFNPSDFATAYQRDEMQYVIDDQETLPQVELTTADSQDYKPSIVLVEDNDDLRAFIKNVLEHQYHIYDCENGLRGWETIIEQMPDLIISDVMMPEMSGLELCRKVKTDERTSHIPVVLLTARSTYVHQINGFENGADAYIMKPFSIKILSLNIHNLLQARENIRRKFSNIVTLEPKQLVINQTQQRFIKRLMTFIESNVNNPKFDVPMLSVELGMSQPILYKKVRALTGQSVNDFIKSFRLQKAAQILRHNKGNISETAFAVGFRDRKYFSAEFKKQFGKTPSEFILDEKANDLGD